MSDSTFTIDKENLEVRAERLYTATPERLFQAYTDPEQIPKWWGPREMKTVVDKLDFRVGGPWRFVSTAPDGTVHAFNGIYKEINEPGKIADTFEYEPVPGHILLETTTFEVQPDGRTKLTTVSKFDNLGDLEGMVAMDMQSGQLTSLERLAELTEGGD